MALSRLSRKIIERSASFHASLFRAIERVMFSTLCLQVVSHAPQHFRSFETQDTKKYLSKFMVCVTIIIYDILSTSVLEWYRAPCQHLAPPPLFFLYSA